MKIHTIIPAYNEEATISKVIKGLKSQGHEDIIVVDDGSTDRTPHIAKKEGVRLHSHIINRGLGGALGTGIQAALLENPDIIVTFDGDGQHDPKDIKKLIKPIINGKSDVVIGSRMLNSKTMPFNKKVANKIGNLITWLLFGQYVTDSQSGLRAFSRDAAQKIQIKTNRMEVSSEILKEVKRNNLKIKEIPIKTIYTEYAIKKGQKWWHGFRVFGKLILRKIMR